MHLPELPKGDGALAVWRRAAAARERGDRENAAALRHEQLAGRTGARTASAFHARMAQAHRSSAACHLAAAELHEAFARRLRFQPGIPRPRFMTGVAEACGVRSAALTLVAPGSGQLAVATSDSAARSAQDLEYVLAEGPARDASLGEQVYASGALLSRRWPRYGAGLAELGLGTVVSLPLGAAGRWIGALTVFDPAGAEADLLGEGGLPRIAGALSQELLLGPDAEPWLYGDTDLRPQVHQAAGMLAERQGCSVSDALALIRARAFRDGTDVVVVAERIIGGAQEVG